MLAKMEHQAAAAALQCAGCSDISSVRCLVLCQALKDVRMI